MGPCKRGQFWHRGQIERAVGRDRSLTDQHRHVLHSIGRNARTASFLGEGSQNRTLLDQGLQGPDIQQTMAPRIQRSRKVTATRSQRVVLALIRPPSLILAITQRTASRAAASPSSRT